MVSAAPELRPHALPEFSNTAYTAEKSKGAPIQVKSQVINLTGYDVPIARVKAPQPKATDGEVRESCYIIRRLDQETVSANAMFRAAFPAATADDQDMEMTWLEKQYPSKGPAKNKLAGVWVPITAAGDLAKDYGIEWLTEPLFKTSPTGLDKRIVELLGRTPKKGASTKSAQSTPEQPISIRKEQTITPTGIKTETTTVKVEVEPTANTAPSGTLADDEASADNTAKPKKPRQRKTLVAKGVVPAANGTAVDDAIAKAKEIAKDVQENGITKKRSRADTLEELEQELEYQKKKVRVLVGLAVGLGASAILPFVL